MLALYSFTNASFEPYTMEHFLPIIIGVLIALLSIRVANRKFNEHQKTLLGTALALVPFFCVIGRMGYLLIEGSFSAQLDLPFFLCRFMALILPFVFFTRNRFMLGILYFWVLAGTINAVITPDLLFNFGHWEYNLYWVYHLMLIVSIIYAALVYKMDIKWKDYWNAVLATIAFTIFSGTVNFLLKANYNYLSEKPEVASILDVMGPWPWYIVVVYLLMFFLFFLAFLPYLIRGKKTMGNREAFF